MKIKLLTLLSVFLLCTCQDGSVELTGEYPMQAEIAQLPANEQSDWLEYLQLSEALRREDQAFLAKELRAQKSDSPMTPPRTKRFGFDVKPGPEWFHTEEAKRIGNILLSFQTPSGGWSKRTDMGSRERLPGEAFGHERGYVPTFDNNATTTQIHILAELYSATGEEKYKNAVLAGIGLILQAQYPNGGWPQNFPLTGGYHDYITFNDEVFTNNLRVLLEVQEESEHYAFVTQGLRKEVNEAVARGIDCLLKTQVMVDGVKTIWGAQHDSITLAPAAARKFEPVALASQESVEVVQFLMSLEQPSPQTIEAVNAAYLWFEQNTVLGYRWDLVLGESAAFVEDDDAGPLWGRFAEIGTNRPVFGDRDGSVHYSVEEISRERQIKYNWYTNAPRKLEKEYKKWTRKIIATRSGLDNELSGI